MWTRKRMGLSIAVLIALLGAAFAFQQRAALFARLPASARDFISGLRLGFDLERNVMVPMPDGVRLATNMYFPRDKGADKYPTVLVRLPYDKDRYGEAIQIANFFAGKGYVVAVQDMRGKFASEGEFTPSKDDGVDGSATVDWIARQPWSNGRVGTFGCSALGEAQILLARMRNPHHTALIAQGAGGAMGSAAGRYTYFGQFEGGIFELASGFGWFLDNGSKRPGFHDKRAAVDMGKAIWDLPSIGLVQRYRQDPTDYEDFLSKPLADPYWRGLGYVADEDRFATPALIVNSWQDQTVAETLVLSEVMKRNADTEAARTHHHVIIGPGNHCNFVEAGDKREVGQIPLGPQSQQPYWEWFLAWFDYWLRDQKDGLPQLPPYKFYVMGEDRWIESEQWPPQAVQYQNWYLGGEAAANSVRGKGSLQPVAPAPGQPTQDELVYDPLKPVRTLGGPICCTGNPEEIQGPADQRTIEEREDVLVYTSPPLEKGLRIAGPLKADLYVSSSAKDTDFTAKLVDVWPDGRAYNVQEGALRMRYREGYTSPALLQPGEVYRVTVDMRAIAHYFAPGHRVRLQVSSSNFPRLERNLNTGGNNYDETHPVVAHNRVLRSAEHPSALVLPVLELTE
jgi:putative CocE/NonD family hydrolase